MKIQHPPKTARVAQLLLSPTRLFVYAQAFHFSSGRGRCFSPGGKALCAWHTARLCAWVLDRSAIKWWRVWLEKV